MIWYVLGLLALTLGINYAALSSGFRGLNYHLLTEKKDYEIGEDITLTSVVENGKGMAVSYLRVEEFFPPNFNIRENVYALFILPWQRVRRTYQVQAKKRGLYRLNRASLELGDFIGFASEQKNVELEEEIVVLPKRLPMATSITPLGPLVGDISVKRWIIDDPLMTVGIREYTGTEPERFIHWPSSLRHGHLMVKNFDFTSDNAVLVVLNVEGRRSRWQPPEDELIETGVSLARTVLEEFEAANIPYGLMSNAYNEQGGRRDYFIPSGLGAGHLGNLLHILGRLHFRNPRFFENTLREIRNRRASFTTVIIVTPRVLPAYVKPLELLAEAIPRTVVIAVDKEHLGDLRGNIEKYRYAAC